MPTHQRKGDWLDWRNCYIGHPPSANQTGIPAQRLWSWLSQWRQLEYLASYIGRPDKLINGNGNNDFHIILYAPEKTDTGNATRQLGCYIRLWDIDFAGAGDLDCNWCDPYNTGAPVDVWDLDSSFASGTDDTYGDIAGVGCAEVFLYDGLTYTPTTGTDGFRHSKLTMDNGCVACLTMFEMPEMDLTATNLVVAAGDVGVNEIIRGFDTTPGNSLGALIDLVGDGDHQDESAEANTHRCLFQTTFPVGVYQTNTGGAQNFWQDSDGNGFTYRIRTRNLTGASSGTATTYPAIVLTADEGVDVVFTSGTAGDTWTYTVGVGGVTDQLVTHSDRTDGQTDGLQVDNDAVETITITVDAGAAEECTLQTVSLWEAPEW